MHVSNNSKRYMKRINQPYEGDKDIKIKQYLIY